MKRDEKNKGFTLMETVVTLLIISTVFFSISYKLYKNNEKMELDLTIKKINSIFYKYATTAHHLKKNFIIDLNLKEKKILVKDKDRIVEQLPLPKKLEYGIPFDKKLNPYFQVEITKTGNLSRSFTFYIFGYKKQLENKLTFYTFQKEQILKINIYKPNGLTKVTPINILEYHYSQHKNSDWKEVL